MDTQGFDDLIRAKMQALKVPENESAWAKFAEKEPETVGSDEAFDELIKSKVYRIHPRFKEQHWAAMELRLQLIRTRIQTILLSKAMEGLGVLLIVLTYSLGYKTPMEPVQLTPKNNAGTSSERPVLKPKRKEAIAQQLTKVPASHHPTKIDMQTGWHMRKTEPKTEFDDSSIEFNHNSVQIENLTPADVADFSIAVLDVTLPNAERKTKEIQGEDVNPEESNLSQITAQLAAAVFRTPETEMAFSMGNRVMAQEHFPASRLYLGGYATADVNLINTPFDKLYSISSYKREAINHSFGLSISGRKSQLEWEAGLEFVQRKYKPAAITETYGQGPDYYFETSLKEIRYAIAGIPIHLKYHFAEQASWSTYMVTTLQTNLIMDAAYTIEEELKHGRPMPSRYTPEAPRLEEKSFIKGLLHGESLYKNYYIHAGLGLGMQKTLFQHTSMYFQTSYFRHIISHDIGIGPNKDKIHGTSFQLGIKTLLK